MTLTNAAEAGLLNRFFNKTSIFDTATTLHLAAFTADPTDAGSLANEVPNANDYARVATPEGNWGAPDGADPNTVSNSVAISFPAASGGNWGTVTHVALVSNTTEGGGDVYFVAALSASRVINDGDTLTFPIGDLSFSLT